jgi:hypothetical protein
MRRSRVSPSAPPAGESSFSLSGNSVLGSGGLVLLLFCILATGPIVLRQDSRLVLALRELPKSSSTLKRPWSGRDHRFVPRLTSSLAETKAPAHHSTHASAT